MAALYIDEDFPNSAVNALIGLGHDVVTAGDDRRAGQGIDDADVLARASSLGRAVVTFNRWDFHRLHRQNPNHAGIITCTDDPDRPALAQRIDLTVRSLTTLQGQLIRIVRPNNP